MSDVWSVSIITAVVEIIMGGRERCDTLFQRYRDTTALTAD